MELEKLGKLVLITVVPGAEKADWQNNGPGSRGTCCLYRHGSGT